MDVLDCTIKARCLAPYIAVDCYCGSVDAQDCIAGRKRNGTCMAKIEAGLETTSSEKMLVSSWHDVKLGGGVALSLVDCLGRRGCAMCL